MTPDTYEYLYWYCLLLFGVWNMNSDESTLLEDAVRKNSYDYKSFQKLLEILQSSSVDHFGNCALLPIRQVYFSNSVYSQKSWRNIDLFLFRGSYQIIFSGSHGLRMRLSILGKTLKRWYIEIFIHLVTSINISLISSFRSTISLMWRSHHVLTWEYC